MRKNIQPKKRDLVDETAVITAISSPEEIGKLTVTGICKMLRIPRSTLDKQFQAELRITVDEFLSRQKIFKAGFFIESDLANAYSIKEIAAIFGYRSSRQFSSTFEKFMATTPENYRRYKQVMEMKNGPNQETEPYFIDDFYITSVTNLNQHGFDFAFIVSEAESYRLIAYNVSDSFLIDSRFKGIAGAKAKFKQLTKGKKHPIFGKRVTWSPFCYPLKSWWAARMEEIESIRSKGKRNDGRHRPRYRKIA